MYHFITCPLCNGQCFFDLGNQTSYGCPLCKLDGSILCRDGKPVDAVVPGALVRRIIEDLEAE